MSPFAPRFCPRCRSTAEALAKGFPKVRRVPLLHGEDDRLDQFALERRGPLGLPGSANAGLLHRAVATHNDTTHDKGDDHHEDAHERPR